MLHLTCQACEEADTEDELATLGKRLLKATGIRRRGSTSCAAFTTRTARTSEAEGAWRSPTICAVSRAGDDDVARPAGRYPR